MKLNLQLGKTRSTAWPYLKMLATVLFRNPSAIESAVNLSAMFIHFQKQSQFIIKHIHREIKTIESRQDKKMEMVTRDHDIPEIEFVEESPEFMIS